MAWNTLKAAIAEDIKPNGNQEITGQVMQDVLLNMVSNLGENATFVGVATPSTNPGTYDGPVFYFAIESGTYSNFGGAEVGYGLTVLVWDGTSWSAHSLLNISESGDITVEGYTLPEATTTTLGGVKLGSDIVQDVAAETPTSEAGRTYPVQVNADGQLVVNVPFSESESESESSTSGIVILTQAEYDALSDKDENIIYAIRG